ncbi:hypothetical protein [Alteraurantiacibacter aquimixticola]|nr:hypothetical protein [Alteraurantiacibacter aquimixticola]
MNLGPLNHVGVATPSIPAELVIASEAKQSRAALHHSGLPRGFAARNDA